MNSVEPSPLRSLDDFILQKSRFQLPDFKDPSRWINRVVNNLLYYQSNYFLIAIVLFLIVGIYHPFDMIVGMLSLGAAFSAFAYATNNQAQLRSLKRKYPVLGVLFILIAGYCIIYVLGSVFTFLFGIALPLLAILIHSSVRLRNLHNKITTKLEYVGLKRSPMGLFLESLGMEEQAGA